MMLRLVLLTVFGLASAISHAQTTTGPALPPSPALLKMQLAQGFARKLSVRHERWWTGSVAYQGGTVTQAYNIVATSNTSPDILTLDKPAGTGNAPAIDNAGTTGTQVFIRGMAGDTGPNATTCYVTTAPSKTGFSDQMHVACYSNSNLSTPIAGNGTLADGGTMGVGTTNGADRGSNGESADLWNVSGSGCMTAIDLICGLNFEQFDSVLWIYVDGDVAGSPSLKIPFCDLFASNYVAQNGSGPAWGYNKITGNQLFTSDDFDLELNAWDNFTGASIGGMRIRFKYPIPFSTGCRATIMHRGSSDNNSANYYLIAEYTPDVTSPLRLKAATFPALSTTTSTDRNAGTTTSAGSDFTMLNLGAGNSGWIAGTCMSMLSFANDSTGSTIFERNVYFAKDGESPPSYQSSGTEDYFGSSYYWGGANHFQGNGCFGVFLREGGTISAVTDTAYAVLFRDNLQADSGGFRFSNGCTMKWVAGPDNGAGIVQSSASCRSTVLYYQ